MHSILLDTGALVALLDQSERNHGECVDFYRDATGRFLTTEAVLTEAIYLLGPHFPNQKICMKFVLDGGAMLVPATPESLTRALALMEKYQDVPMDFADATLVVLGEEVQTNEIFSLDRRGFLTYRLGGRKAFKIYPGLI